MSTHCARLIFTFSGILRVAKDLYGQIYPPVYELALTAWDFMYMDVGNLTIYLMDTRHPPTIENLDNLTTIPEDAPAGSDIYQVFLLLLFFFIATIE